MKYLDLRNCNSSKCEYLFKSQNHEMTRGYSFCKIEKNILIEFIQKKYFFFTNAEIEYMV